MAKNKKYEEFLLKELKDREMAIAYLNDALEEGLNGDEESWRLFPIALRNVAEAHGGIAALAKKNGVEFDSFDKALLEGGSLDWNAVMAICEAMGLRLRFS